MQELQERADAASDEAEPLNLELLTGAELCQLLKANDGPAWRFVLKKIAAQEVRCAKANRQRSDWDVSILDLFAQLYEDMMGEKHRLDVYRGEGSLIGWLRKYLHGYLSKSNPYDERYVSLDEPKLDADGDECGTLADDVAFDLSERRRQDAYDGEDLQVQRRERWEIAGRCFAELWQGNSMQAYVMLLKVRFHMSSAEVQKRLGVSSTANVDQMFSRAVKKMKELRCKYE